MHLDRHLDWNSSLSLKMNSLYVDGGIIVE